MADIHLSVSGSSIQEVLDAIREFTEEEVANAPLEDEDLDVEDDGAPEPGDD